jgi:hypothetical protein
MLAKAAKDRPTAREVFEEIESLLGTPCDVLERTSGTRIKVGGSAEGGTPQRQVDVHADTAAA